MPNRVTGNFAPQPSPSTSDQARYTVKSGDTLSAIAHRAGVSVEALVNLNQAQYPGITNPRALQVGWSLQLPSGATAPANAPAAAPAAAPSNEWKPKSNDKVLFVAVNNSYEHRSTTEADAIKARGTDIKVIQDAAVPDTITTTDARGTKTTHDLTTEAGATAFALTLGLPAEQTKKIATVILNAGEDAKDEIANIAQEWAKAERGGQIPSRLILSGHHVGSGVYGENNGRLDWPTVGSLAEAMPRAARSVEDLMIAGCYSGGQTFMEKYQSMFPNVKTIVAYQGSSPGAASGATAHQKAWEKATRGSREDINLSMFAGMRKGENVSVWTASHGLQGGEPLQLSGLREQANSQQSDFDDAFTGAVQIRDPQDGPVRRYYNTLQRLLQHPELPSADRPGLEARRDQTIRLLFYGPVSTRFAEVHGARTAQAYQSLGLPVPDFKSLTRGEALAAIANFETALAGRNPPPAAAAQFAPTLRGLKELSPSVIPDTWV